jgi:hypothetical protein
MKKKFYRLAFVLVLAAVGSRSQGYAAIVGGPSPCHPGQACSTFADCGNCTRCGWFCKSGACLCLG